MARYRGTIQGQRGGTSRLGSPKSGLTATINGWDIGVYIRIDPDSTDPTRDVVRVFRTGGSHGYSPDTFIAEFKED